MPAGAVEDQDDLLGGTRSRLAGKGGQFGFKERDADARREDARREMEEGATRRGMDEADQVAPGVAMLHRRDRSLPDRSPNATEEGLEANAMLIRRPQLDGSVRKRRCDLPHERS